MTLMRFLLRVSKTSFFLSVIAGLISGISTTLVVTVINETLQRPPEQRSGLIWAFAGLCVIVLLSKVIAEVLLIRLAARTVFRLRMELSQQIIQTPLRHLEELGRPRIMASLANDILSISDATAMLPVACTYAAIVLTCIAYLGWMSWVVLLVILGFIVFGVVSFELMTSRGMTLLRKAREENDIVFKHLRAITEGTKELQMNGQRADLFLNQELRGNASAFQRHNTAGMSLYTVAYTWGQLMFFIAIGVIVFALPRFMRVSTGDLVGYTLIILYMIEPLSALLKTSSIFGRARVSLKKLDELRVSLTPAISALNVAPLATSWRSLRLEGVQHTYYVEREETNFTLGPVDLHFKPGEVIFLIGGNGSGKTTLAKILMGLYPPEAGSIRVDNTVVTDANRAAYRQLFSVVFSDFYLFDNLVALEQGDLDARASEYLADLHLDHKVRVKDGRLSTIELSQGQRKRLALLGAYLEDRPFYVFDEWAADQDPTFKEVFYTRIVPELKAAGKTVLVISHDDKYFQHADRTIKLNYGQIEATEALGVVTV